jgi:sigma-B regulation protein RsbU (phosphoserine phosphatase)
MSENDTLVESFLNQAPLAIIVVNQKGLIVTSNARTEIMFGYQAGEMIGKPVEVLIPEGMRHKHVQERQSYNANPFTRPMGTGLDLVGLRKDGSTFPVEIGLSHTRSADGIKITCFISDISQRKQADQEMLLETSQEQERMVSELQMAHKVQSSFLPRRVPLIPGWSMAVAWQPLRQVAGDFYDFIPRKQGELDVLISDVVDKGIPAALFMAFVHPILRDALGNGTSPAEGIKLTNRRLCLETNLGFFATLFLARLHLDTGQVVYVNAGHNPPLHYHAEDGRITNLQPTGMAMGIEPQASYEQAVIQLARNDLLVLYTDGVTEAANVEEQAFGVEHLEQVVRKHKGAKPQELTARINEAVCEFMGSQSPTDDITVMVMKREST